MNEACQVAHQKVSLQVNSNAFCNGVTHFIIYYYNVVYFKSSSLSWRLVLPVIYVFVLIF